MKPRYQAVLFDIDDTLLKTREPKWRQHIYVARKYYGIHLTDKDLYHHWGKPFDELTSALYHAAGSAAERRANFIRHELEFPKEYEPFAPECIQQLHNAGIVLGLMTSMYTEGAKVDLENLKMSLDYFVFLQGSDDQQHHKPDGRVFATALAKLRSLGIDKGMVYIGEALSDFEAARSAGLDFIALTQGLVTAAEFSSAGARPVFANLAQVTGYLLPDGRKNPNSPVIDR